MPDSELAIRRRSATQPSVDASQFALGDIRHPPLRINVFKITKELGVGGRGTDKESHRRMPGHFGVRLQGRGGVAEQLLVGLSPVRVNHLGAEIPSRSPTGTVGQVDNVAVASFGCRWLLPAEPVTLIQV